MWISSFTKDDLQYRSINFQYKLVLVFPVSGTVLITGGGLSSLRPDKGGGRS